MKVYCEVARSDALRAPFRLAGLPLGLVLMLALGSVGVRASVDEALNQALEAASPHLKEGFTVREDQSGGDLAVGDRRAVRYQLFKGNEYWFWGAVDVPKAKVHFRVLDSAGLAIESERWERGTATGIRVVPPKTGSYFVVIEILGSPRERTGWAVIYGFR